MCTLDENHNEVNNSIELFLDGKIIYEVLEGSDKDHLDFRDINMNLQDTSNESIFYNFDYKRFEENEIGIVN